MVGLVPLPRRHPLLPRRVGHVDVPARRPARQLAFLAPRLYETGPIPAVRLVPTEQDARCLRSSKLLRRTAQVGPNGEIPVVVILVVA